LRNRTFKEKKDITANKEKLEAEINAIAIEYTTLSKQENNDDEIIILRKQLLEYIFIYCRDHIYFQEFIPKSDVISSEKYDNFIYFHFSEEIVDILDRCIIEFNLNYGNNFINFWNATLFSYLPKSKRILIYDEYKCSGSIPLYRKKINNRIKKGSQILVAAGKIHEDNKLWTQEDIDFISQHCHCSINDVNIYINHCFYFSKINTESLIYSDDYDTETDPIKYLKSDENIEEEVINKIGFDETGCIEKILSAFSETDDLKKPYYRKLLTLYFIKIGFKNIDFAFIDKEYAGKLDEEYNKSGKYLSFKILGDEYGDSNPTQTRDRFLKNVREIIC